jgi:hypothetical protein
MIISTDNEEMYNLKAFYSKVYSTCRRDSFPKLTLQCLAVL